MKKKKAMKCIKALEVLADSFGMPPMELLRTIHLGLVAKFVAHRLATNAAKRKKRKPAGNVVPLSDRKAPQ